jgi:cytosine/adenosine deaminase-related metal-dependent hydrolase
MARSESSVILITADAICDANLSVVGDRNSPAALLIEHSRQTLRVLEVGMFEQLTSHPAYAHAGRIDRPGCVVLPGLVNAHTHLDLTHIGPRPHDPSAGFVSWVDMVRTNRHTAESEVADSVRQGCDLLRKGGVSIVGDIAGAAGGQPTLVPYETLAESSLAGVSFLEFFAIGTRTTEAIHRLTALVRSIEQLSRGGVRFGLQPHAPNTVAPPAFLAAGKLADEFGLPMITHLAESIEEQEFVADGTGPQLELIQRLGIWNDQTATQFGKGQTPIQHLAAVLAGFHLNAVHVNQCSDEDLNLLALTGTCVVYCPRASEYFGAQNHFGPHRYRQMLDRGICVALGTDSIINLPESEIDSTGLGLSSLAEARHLYQRDNTDPRLLMQMMTVNGTDLLGLPQSQVSLAKGASPSGIIAIASSSVVEPTERILRSEASPEFLV